MRSHDLHRLLDFDPARAAADSGARDPRRLAGALAIEHHRRLRALLQEFGDSHLGQPFEDFLGLAEELGFTALQEEELWMGGPARFVALHKDGLLICADSYQGMVNQARLLVRSAYPVPGAEAHGRLYRAALDVRSGLRTRIDALRDPLPCCLAADIRLLPGELAGRLDPSSWPRRDRRRLRA